MKTVLITGSSGFVGGYLRKEFENNGYKVVGSDLRAGNAEYIMDVTKSEDVERVIGEVRPDYIVHLAGFASVKESFNHPELCRLINVTGTKNVMDAVVTNELKSRVLIISSSDLYKDKLGVKLTEESEQGARSPYGESRLEQEKLVNSYKNVDWVISRSFPHVGPGQPKGFVTSDFASQIADIARNPSLKREMYVGNLEGIRDFTDVRDTVVAYRLLLEKGKSHEAYNVCSGKEIQIRKLLDILLAFFDEKIEIKVMPDKLRVADIKYNVGDNVKLIRDTSWTIKYEIEQTLKEIYQFWFNS